MCSSPPFDEEMEPWRDQQLPEVMSQGGEELRFLHKMV